MDGLEMIGELRCAFPTAKIIAMSREQRALTMVKTFIQHTLEKPLCMRELLYTVQQLVSTQGLSGVKHSSAAALDNIQVGM